MSPAVFGTLGAGNHFIEVDRVSEVHDQATAAHLQIYPDNVAVQIHCGSRGLGHQICEDYVSRFQKTAQDYGITLPDRELVCVPFDSEDGQEYLRAMACSHAAIDLIPVVMRSRESRSVRACRPMRGTPRLTSRNES
ncbi:MAG: RtcB family protein [Acidobacteriia bacterium]|nr:RtcB family protein [Terriglobia bacterium]